MKFEKNHIISEIIRTAKENGNKPLGKDRFFTETGIKFSDWHGKYWVKWGDALFESGFQPNTFQKAYDEDFVLEKLISLIKELGKFPTHAEIRIKKQTDTEFPSQSAFRTLGNQSDHISKVVEYCKRTQEMNDVLQICLPLLQLEKEIVNDKTDVNTTNIEFVYLMKSGKYYKIGRSNDAERRAYDIRLQMPDKLDLVHKISTDDSIGIEEYWHKRFKDKRKNGEWFELTRQEVEIFKRRKFM
jgi:Meiotically up-regulated gene 113